MKKNRFWSALLFTLLLAVVLVSLYCSFAGSSAPADKPAAGQSKSNAELYAEAVRDAVFADEDEIFPLVNISRYDPNVIWKDDKVLVSFLHKYPAAYPDGGEITLEWGNVWCVSAGELYQWVREHGGDVTDWNLRLHQIMGMPEGKATTITSLWVDADLLYRPAYVTDAQSGMQNVLQPTGDPEFDASYKEWFDGNIIWSYFDSAYPWTRLGYTYDWADNGTEYGLTEFLIFSGASAKVETTHSLEDFVDYVMPSWY